MTIHVHTNTLCGFCNDKNHKACSVGVRANGRRDAHPDGLIWACRCENEACGPGRRKCTYCNNRNTEEVDPGTWECFDIEACRASVQTKRESDPLYHQMNEIKEKADMAKIEENKEKAAKRAEAKPKTGTCVCGCEGTTKGGKFLPGHDARFVSTLVKSTADAKFTAKSEQAARKALKDVGASDALVGKFDKQFGIAKDKAEKKAAADAEKKAAKAEASKS